MFLQFPEYDFFQNDKRMLFQCYTFNVMSCFQLTIVLLEENTARNPEFGYDRFELADNSECRANFILKHDLPESAAFP